MNADSHSSILAKLRNAVSEDEIIFSICQETGLDWPHAQALVEQEKLAHRAEIEASQVPIKSALALVFFIIGIILTIAPFIYLWLMLDMTQTLILVSTGQVRTSANTLVDLFIKRCLLLGWFQLPSIIFTTLVGVAMIYANLRFIQKLWSSRFHRTKAPPRSIP
jgi:hypothetical protein